MNYELMNSETKELKNLKNPILKKEITFTQTYPMAPIIKTLPEKILIGKHVQMTMAENKTGELWKSFMPRRREIVNAANTWLYSLDVYDPGTDFLKFTPYTPFEKWAAVEVTAHGSIPDGLEPLVLTGGEYAVFVYKGDSRDGGVFFQNIFTTWLPASGLSPDSTRPHFALMGDKYRNNDPDSEEEIWVPVTKVS